MHESAATPYILQVLNYMKQAIGIRLTLQIYCVELKSYKEKVLFLCQRKQKSLSCIKMSNRQQGQQYLSL